MAGVVGLLPVDDPRWEGEDKSGPAMKGRPDDKSLNYCKTSLCHTNVGRLFF